MNKKELESLVLDKTEEAYTLVNSLGDEDGEALDYFRELINFYSHPKNEDIYLKDFKDFYTKSVDETIKKDKRDLKIYELGERNLKGAQITMAALGALSLGGAILFEPILGIPTAYFIWKFNAVYDRLKRLREEKKEKVITLEKAKKEKEVLESIDTKVLAEVLNENKAVVEDYFERVFSD